MYMICSILTIADVNRADADRAGFGRSFGKTAEWLDTGLIRGSATPCLGCLAFLSPRSPPHVHSDRADAESGHPEIPAGLHRHGFGHRQFPRARRGVAL